MRILLLLAALMFAAPATAGECFPKSKVLESASDSPLSEPPVGVSIPNAPGEVLVFFFTDHTSLAVFFDGSGCLLQAFVLDEDEGRRIVKKFGGTV